MFILCVGIYFVAFTVLARRFRRAATTRMPDPANQKSAPLRCLASPDLWLCGFLLIVGLTYACDYQKASASIQPLLLLLGAAFGRGVATWALWAASTSHEPKPVSQVTRAAIFLEHPIARMKLILSVLVLLLVGAALWQPAIFTEFQYRGVRRWSGAWDNPNTYGILMASGMVLAVGILISEGGKQKTEHTIRRTGLQSLLPCLWITLSCLCGFGLLKSYSRGAWLGVVIGLSYIVWQWRAGKARLSPDPLPRPSAGEGESVPRPSWFNRNLRLLSILLASVLVLAFWQFRHTDWPLARRLFSVANINDFSWRNRITTWQGELRMMANRPLTGFGWLNAEQVYQEKYRARRLEETAAIQMNDYFMLGISTGLPALLFFAAYLALSICRPFSTGCHSSALFASAGAGALVLLVGFWFDGGLFKLPTAAVFWTLLELTRITGNSIPVAATATVAKRNAFRAPLLKPAHRDTWLRWLTGICAVAAVALSALHWVIPQLPVNEYTVAIARRCIVPESRREDFEFLSARLIWRGKRLKTLLEHIDLAGYNRELVPWKLDEHLYRDFVLSPEIDFAFDGEMNWRRPLWEYFYPRIRKETNSEAAAELVQRQLGELVRITAFPTSPDEPPASNSELPAARRRSQLAIRRLWENGEANIAGFEAVHVATLRSVGIPARLGKTGHVELWSGGQWKTVPPN